MVGRIAIVLLVVQMPSNGWNVSVDPMNLSRQRKVRRKEGRNECSEMPHNSCHNCGRAYQYDQHELTQSHTSICSLSLLWMIFLAKQLKICDNKTATASNRFLDWLEFYSLGEQIQGRWGESMNIFLNFLSFCVRYRIYIIKISSVCYSRRICSRLYN